MIPTQRLVPAPAGETVESLIDHRPVAVPLPEVGGVLTASEVEETAASIAAVQRHDGMIPWSEGGHCDPWNHVEAAMGLTIGGFHKEALRAYQWLADSQLPDGSWFNYYLPGAGVKDPRLDTNVCAYVATGGWHHFRVTGDTSVLAGMWPMIDRALTFVLKWQTEDGTVLWSVDPDGRPGRYPLLTGSSSIYHALRCGVACAEALGRERPDWELAAGRLAHAIAVTPDVFEPKDDFAMDWYYPVLSGALEGAPATARMERWWDTFVMDGLGVRCVSTNQWVTAAETAECVLALDAVGRRADALALFTWAQAHRCDDGSYWTGIVHPGRETFPFSERTTYTAAAIILAADALADASPAAGLFRGESLPRGLDLTAPPPESRRP
ncbi:MAG TPA: hypothetical protein VN816_00640 [Acidimicrobiales bacterium]|nr:hypothetical protein [Acidimicrobiales bacterium]